MLRRLGPAVRLDAGVTKDVLRDALERVGRGERAEEPRVGLVEHHEDDVLRVIRWEEAGERADVEVVDVAAVRPGDLRGARLPGDAESGDGRVVRDADVH